MSSTAPNLATALKAEFDLMNQQVYPYVASGTSTAVFVRITNTSTLSQVTIYPTTLLKFDDGLGTTYPYDFYPHIDEDIIINPSSSVDVIFETTSTEVSIPITALMKLYNSGTLVLDISLDRTDIIDSDNETLYYFVYRMTSILGDRINTARIYDPDSGQDQGAGYLDVSFSMIKNAFNYAWPNILGMQTNPSTSNGPIINSIDAYLDKLTGSYFYTTIHYSYHSVRQMTSDACDALNNMNLSTTQDAANVMSAEMMADVVDFYCNGALS